VNQANQAGLSPEQKTTIDQALTFLQQQDYTGTSEVVSVDGAGYIREIKSTVTFASGASVVGDQTYSDFGCAGTVYLPLQRGRLGPNRERVEGSVDFRHSDAVPEWSEESIAFDPTHWLLLIYRIPTEPTRLRAGVWRKLKGLGAIYLQNSAIALPFSPHSERALRTLRAEIQELGGKGSLFSSTTLAGQDQLVETFNAARDDEYDEIIDKCDDFLQQVHKEYDANHFTYAELEENEVDLVKLKGWLEKIRARDVLGASKLQATVEAVERCDHVLEEYAARVYAEEGEEPSPL
jgi:hypothetical protein